MKALADLPQDLVARDGKTLRRSRDRADGKGPVHVVKAWASANEGGPAQGKVDATTTALTALPALLRPRTLTGAVVTVDALGCQGEIARQTQAQGADYVLSFQGNQPSVYRMVPIASRGSGSRVPSITPWCVATTHRSMVATGASRRAAGGVPQPLQASPRVSGGRDSQGW